MGRGAGPSSNWLMHSSYYLTGGSPAHVLEQGRRQRKESKGSFNKNKSSFEDATLRFWDHFSIIPTCPGTEIDMSCSKKKELPSSAHVVHTTTNQVSSRRFRNVQIGQRHVESVQQYANYLSVLICKFVTFLWQMHRRFCLLHQIFFITAMIIAYLIRF